MKEKITAWWNKFAMYMRKYSTPAQLTVFLSAITITFLLFVPPINGDADNGTFFITLHGNGLYQLPNYPYTAYSHIALKYGIMQYFNSYPHPIVSTTTFFVQIAIALNKLFYSTKIFDIRFLGLTYFMFYLGALYLLTNAFTSKQKTSRDYAIALVIWFIFSDSSLTLFFNSFYLEPVHLITMLYAVGAYGLIARRYYRRLWPMLIVYFVAVFGFIATKQQNTFFVAGWLLTAFGMFALTKTRVQKLAVAVTMVLIVGAGLFSNYCVSTKYNDENKYQSMTCGILAESNNPEKALADGGISPQFALLRDDPYFKTYTALDVHSKYMKDNFLNKYNYLWITSYYVSHWNQFNQLLNAAAANAQNMQMYGLGNYPPHSGHPAKAQTHYFMLFTLAMRAFFPRKFMFYVLIVFVFICFYIYVAFKGMRKKEGEPLMRCMMVMNLIVIMIGTFFGTIIGGGDADLAQQLFMVPICLYLLILIFTVDILHKKLW